MTAYQTNLVTFVLIVRIPPEGIEDFRAYEDAVLPLLPEFNGRLERRLRNPDGSVEMHIISFASDADFQNYRNDPRLTHRPDLTIGAVWASHQPMLERCSTWEQSFGAEFGFRRL